MKRVAHGEPVIRKAVSQSGNGLFLFRGLKVPDGPIQPAGPVQLPSFLDFHAGLQAIWAKAGCDVRPPLRQS